MPIFKGRDRENGKKVYYYAFWHNGSRVRKSGFLTRREAQVAENQRRLEVHQSGHLDPSKRITMGGLYDQYLESLVGRKSENTIRGVKSRRTPIMNYFADRRVDLITQQDIEEYARHRFCEDDICGRTVNHELSALQCAFEFAKKSKLIVHNPVIEVERLQAVQEDPVLPTNDELKRLLDEALKTRTGYQLYTWIYLLTYTGLRPAESLNVQWRDVDFENNRIVIKRTILHQLKTRKPRCVFLHQDLRPVLLKWREEWEKAFGSERPHDWVFFHPQDKNERPKGMRTSFNTAARRAGLKKMHPYVLRHLHVTRALESHLDKVAIMEAVGHSTSKMIDEVYGNVSPDYVAREMSKLKIL